MICEMFGLVLSETHYSCGTFVLEFYIRENCNKTGESWSTFSRFIEAALRVAL